MKDVPEELRGHKAMAGVTEKIIEVLGNMLNKLTQSDPSTASWKLLMHWPRPWGPCTFFRPEPLASGSR